MLMAICGLAHLKELLMSIEKWECKQLSILMRDCRTVRLPGIVLFEPTGKVEVVIHFRGRVGLADVESPQDINGQACSNFAVVVEGAFATQANFDSATGISTVIFVPVEVRISRPNSSSWTRRDVYLKSVRLIGLTKFSDQLCNYELRPLHNYDDKRQGLIRAVMSIQQTAGRICNYDAILTALSLAQRCLIQSPMQKSFNGDDLVEICLISNEMPNVVMHPLIPISPRELSDYLTQVLPDFATKEANFQIERLIHYYCLSISATYGEVKFILASVVMEAFKFFWALNDGNKLPVLKANKLIRGFQKATDRHGKPVLYGFEELLTEACVSIGYNPVFTFIEDRNALFHSGAPGAHQHGVSSSWRVIKPELVTLYRQIDDVLLRVLAYQGPICRWDAPDTQEAFP